MSKTAVQMRWGVKIPLRDGVQLNATLYLPEGQTNRRPVIFTLTPYVGQTFHDRGIYFAQHGYPFLTVDVRGRGNSEGIFKANINEAKDGYDVVEWLAQQPYCDGQVAMWGGSYAGFDQWAAAKEFPPHLATIVPVASPRFAVDFPAQRNIFHPYLVQWLTFVSGHALQERIFGDARFWAQQFRRLFESGAPFKSLDSFIGNPSPTFQEWIAHPEQGAYWDEYNPQAQHYAKLTIPILTITGIYDGDQLGALSHYRQHMQHTSPEGRARHYLIIGPWDHAGTRTPQAQFCGLKFGEASLLDLPKLHLEWYAWTLQGGSRPQFLQKPVAYYVTGAEKWRYADTLEHITARQEPLYLQSHSSPVDVFHSGSLVAIAPERSSPDRYLYDPRDVRLAELESTLDPEDMTEQRMVHARNGRQLVYHSAPFEQEREISGFFKFTAWLSIDTPDTDFAVKIYEIDLQGCSILLAWDNLRARYRESLHTPKLIQARQALRYDFDAFNFVSRQIKQGHRLRLIIGPVDSIYVQKNFNSGGVVAEESMQDARPVQVQLFHDAAHPSALYIPIAHPES